MEPFVTLTRSQLVAFFKDWKELAKNGGCEEAPDIQTHAERAADYIIDWAGRNA